MDTNATMLMASMNFLFSVMFTISTIYGFCPSSVQRREIILRFAMMECNTDAASLGVRVPTCMSGIERQTADIFSNPRKPLKGWLSL
ncbi:hypothetical protein [Rhodoferax sp. UBA5149]|uniref:hypothetical protein n=1 Tax=Rhodoferax sp. UBA5149 TaxID=1947379 RepID=UPI0025ED7FA8|nr:hypothetical protein [Rhodoferax sp. UBA5149]